MSELARANLYIGTSSWKYEGWVGSIYQPERYVSRGRFSRMRFQRDCLTEFAEVFPTVSGDFSFYQFPTASFWKSLFEQVPSGFHFAFKAPEEITTPLFPRHPRYGARAGQTNPFFLNADMLRAQFLAPLEQYASAVGVIVFEFPAALEGAFGDVETLCDALSRFFEQLPKTFRYAVEIRHVRLFCNQYFRALCNHGIAHVFNSWTEMPSIADQMTEPDAFTTNFNVSRALTVPGRGYEETVARFTPYNDVKDVNDGVRDSLRALLSRSKRRGEPTFVYVNNRLEGFAPGTIAAIIEMLD